MDGVAIEARVNAEDSETGFLPSPGILRAFRLDDLGVRVDSGFEEGDAVSPHYDSLIAKLIAHAESRDEAIARLDAALARAVVMGPKTNIAFLRRLLAADEFHKGKHDTGFIDANLERLGAVKQPPDARAALAGVEAIYAGIAPPPAPAVEGDPWSVADAFELLGPRRMPFEAEVDGRKESFVAIARGGPIEIAFRDGRLTRRGEIAPTVLAVEDGVLVLNAGRQTHVAPLRLAADEDESGEDTDGEVRAPMHGRLIALAVSEGDEVEAGARIAVLEAMKMEHALTAPRAGRVTLKGHKVGDIVEPGEVVARVEAVA